ncbi:hypothetical protein GCM10023084_63360 [Streptomyces lacrimifluminis]|uniref:Uncharacterized protein n=1 Tax=Streptomyces lacrimifluminis TaxID=1500077 RepID=A0A917L4M9_9ACTN|nr:hypothetical protein GCM10012282_44400 [Streptomyces lacrimifluminis]
MCSPNSAATDGTAPALHVAAACCVEAPTADTKLAGVCRTSGIGFRQLVARPSNRPPCPSSLDVVGAELLVGVTAMGRLTALDGAVPLAGDD